MILTVIKALRFRLGHAGEVRRRPVNPKQAPSSKGNSQSVRAGIQGAFLLLGFFL